MESKAEEIVNESKALQLSLEELQQMIACLYEGIKDVRAKNVCKSYEDFAVKI